MTDAAADPSESSDLDEPSGFRPRRDVRFRIIDREAVVLRQQQGEALVLNEVGARILQLLAAGSSHQAMIETLIDEYQVEPEQVERDVASFISELEASGIVEPVADTARESS